MSKRLNYTLFVLLLVGAISVTLFIFTGVAQAQTQALETGKGISSSIVSCSGAVAQDGLPACGWCSFVKLIGNLIQYEIFLAVTLSSLMFAYAGFLFLTNNGNSRQVTRAWAIFRRVIYGIVGILVAWLIVNAIMTKIAGNDQWMSLECVQGDASTGGANSQGQTGGANGFDNTASDNDSVVVGSLPSTDYQDAILRKLREEHRRQREQDDQLANSNNPTKVDKIDCSDFNDYRKTNDSGCTSSPDGAGIYLDGLNQNTANVLYDLKNSCTTYRCKVHVTRAAESTNANTDNHANDGVYTYANGYNININALPEVTNFLTSNLTLIGDSQSGTHQFIDKCGNNWSLVSYDNPVYEFVKSEWVVTVKHSVPDGSGSSCFN